MMIDKNGKCDNSVKAILHVNGTEIMLTDNQFFQETPSGKRIELWEGGEFGKRIKYWNRNSIIGIGRTE